MRKLLAVVLVCVLGVAWAADKEIKLTKDEQLLVDLTNKERVKAKVPPLKVSPILMQTARMYSANMARTGQYSHFIDGKKPYDRAQALGYKSKFVGENLARQDGAEVKNTVKKWMDSPHHRRNILKPEYTEIGIGLAPDPENKGFFFITQNFGNPEIK